MYPIYLFKCLSIRRKKKNRRSHARLKNQQEEKKRVGGWEGEREGGKKTSELLIYQKI